MIIPSFSFQSAIMILLSKKLISGVKSSMFLGTSRLWRSSLLSSAWRFLSCFVSGKSARREYQPQSYVLPDNIRDVKDDILKMVLACEACGKNYKIIPQELRRLRAMPMPIPRKCPDCRHSERMSLRNPRKLWERQCAKCKKSVKSTFSKDKPETIYCDECYTREIY